MMRRNSIYIFLFIPLAMLLLLRCAGFEPVAIGEDPSKSVYSTASIGDSLGGNSVETPKLTDGVFEDFQKDLSGWWSVKDVIKFFKEKDYLKVEVNKTSPGFPQFGYTFDAKDFSGTPVLRIKMRAEGDTPPKVRVDLRDVNDVQTNAVIVSNDIALTGEFVDYYFDINNKFRQSWPVSGIVDPRQINGITFFVNPGDKPFKGTIYIKEIYVMANKDGSGIISQERVIDDFSGDINYWWGCDKEKVLLYKENSTMRVNFKNGQWACFGMSFDAMDVSPTPVIKLRIRAKSASKLDEVDIVPWFTDVHNKTTNKEHLIQKVAMGTNFVDFFYDYTGRMESAEGTFNPKEVNSIIIFVNTMGSSVFSGDIYVDEVTLLPSVPKYVAKRKFSNRPTFIDPSWLKGAESFSNILSDDLKKWKTSSDKILLDSINGTLRITANGVGVDWESFSRTISPVNFIDKPVLKLRIKAQGNISPYLRINLTDNFGNVTDARPAEEKVEIGNGYVECYLDFTGRFNQRFPEYANVNAGAIQKLTFYINGGMEPFTGTLTIAEIQNVSVDDYLRQAK